MQWTIDVAEISAANTLGEVSPFREYHADRVVVHPGYQLYAVMALLLPPLGILVGLAYLLRRGAAHHALGWTLLRRAFTLPLCCAATLLLIYLSSKVSPDVAQWTWW